MITVTAESGSSKTDWVAGGKTFRTKGINFSVMSVRDIVSVVSCAAAEINGRMRDISEPVSVHFYGAGLVSADNVKVMTGILGDFFPRAEIECASDLLAAARALWGDTPGIVAILGTGSNSCSYDGTRITGNISPGGYILGDEGGGAALGKRFISDYIKNLVPEPIAAEFTGRYQLKYADIVNSVYKGPNPAGFLASFAPFVMETAVEGNYSERLIRENFRLFIERSLLPYRHGDERLSVGVVGSVGCSCRDILTSVGKGCGVDFIKFIPAPIEALVKYHLRKNPIFAPV